MPPPHQVLSVCPQNKQAIIGAGGIDAIAKHLGSPCNKTKLHCVWALRNLSDAATNIVSFTRRLSLQVAAGQSFEFQGNLQGLVRSLVELLKSPDIQLVICSAGIIFNLTCNNQGNKRAVFGAGGLQVERRSISNRNTPQSSSVYILRLFIFFNKLASICTITMERDGL